MTTPHHSMHSRFTRTIAVLVCLILGQTLAAALLHTVLVDHIWCETHQDFEHLSDDSDVDDSVEHAQQNAEVPTDAQHPEDKKRTPDNLCFYLTSLHGPAVPLPSIHASLLNLPPPAEVGSDDAHPTGDPAILPRQIDMLHESPGLSPPQLMA